MSSLSLLGLILIGLGVIISIVIIIVVVIAVCSNKKSSSSQAAYQAYTPPQPVQQDNAGEVPSAAPSEAPEKTTLAEAIKNHRIRCGMTQEQVAEAMEVSRQAVSKWETGAAEPSTSNLLALAKLFGISAAELLEGIE